MVSMAKTICLQIKRPKFGLSKFGYAACVSTNRGNLDLAYRYERLYSVQFSVPTEYFSLIQPSGVSHLHRPHLRGNIFSTRMPFFTSYTRNDLFRSNLRAGRAVSCIQSSRGLTFHRNSFHSTCKRDTHE